MLIVNVYCYPRECTWQPSAQCDCRCNYSTPTVFTITCLLCSSFRKIGRRCFMQICQCLSFLFPYFFVFFFFWFHFDYFSPIFLFCFPLSLFLTLLSSKLNDLLLRISFMLEVTGSNLLWNIDSSELGFTWHYFSLQINNTMPCVYKRMLGWFPRLQFATVCFLCSPPDLNFLDPYFIFMYVHNSHCHRETAHLQVNILLLLLLL